MEEKPRARLEESGDIDPDAYELKPKNRAENFLSRWLLQRFDQEPETASEDKAETEETADDGISEVEFDKRHEVKDKSATDLPIDQIPEDVSRATDEDEHGSESNSQDPVALAEILAGRSDLLPGGAPAKKPINKKHLLSGDMYNKAVRTGFKAALSLVAFAAVYLLLFKG